LRSCLTSASSGDACFIDDLGARALARQNGHRYVKHIKFIFFSREVFVTLLLLLALMAPSENNNRRTTLLRNDEAWLMCVAD
jgi:hypothetical protein